MSRQIENNPDSAMARELRQAKEEASRTATTGEGGNPNGQADELPQGASPLQASEETSVEQEDTPTETPEETEGGTDEEQSAPAESEEEPIRLAGRTFKTQKEAFAYAEELERNRELTEAHAAGVREALEATRQPAQPDPEPEDDFEQRFYTDPKGTLREIQTKARDEAIDAIRKENERERMWNQFLSEYPDVRRKDAERILVENWGTIGKMTDVGAAMKALAQKVRDEYDEIINAAKPRTVLQPKKQVLSPSGGAPQRVTHIKKDERPLSFAEEMRKLRGQG